MFKSEQLDGISTRSPEPLRKVFQLILSIAFGVGDHHQKSRTRFPADFAIRIEVPHRIAASFVLVQNLSYELTFGEINVIQFYLVIGYIDLSFCVSWAKEIWDATDRFQRKLASRQCSKGRNEGPEKPSRPRQETFRGPCPQHRQPG